MRQTLLVAVLLGIPTMASAEARLVVSAPTHDGLFTGRQPIADAVTTTGRAQSRTIYLNKNGVTLSPGASDARTNKSSIAAAQSTIPAWAVSSTVWAQTVTCMREMFAPFDVAITETDPGNIPHIEAVFGGHPSNLGLAQRMAGVSPFSSKCNIIENSVVFTFTDVIPANAQIACEIMAQEIAHSYGLDHELLASDPMTYLSYSGKRTFQNQTAECGETSARPCGLPEYTPCREKQNSYALLLERLGAAGTGDIDPPTVAIMSPTNGATVQQGFTVDAAIADDVVVKFATLSIDGVQVASLSAAPWTFTAPELAPGKHLIEVMATDGKHEQVATIEVNIPGDDDESPVGGCSTGGGSGWLLGLCLLGLVAIQRRAQR